MKKIELLSILAIVFLLGLRLSTISSGCDNSHDSFYHIGIADLGPSYYMAKKFPALSLSQWRYNFSDKELSFHLLLTGIRKFLALTGQSTGAPFHVEYLFFAFLVVGSFVFVCWHFKIEKIYLYTMALVAISPFFTTRLMVIRPHMLAIAITMISCVLFNLTDHWKKLWIPLLIGFIMAWSYSNPHFILLPAVALGLAQYRKNWKLALAIPVITLLGIVVGYTVHPQFPNTFINWKIQCIDVMLISFQKSSPVKLGYELTPGNLNFFIEHILLFFMLVLNTGFLFYYIKAKTLKKVDTVLIAFYFMGLISYAGIFAAVRAVEYATPFGLITTGLIIREYSTQQIFNCKPKWKKLIPVFVNLVVLVIFSWAGVNYYKRAEKVTIRPYLHFAEWVKDHKYPPGSVIGNLNWSDFPLLFYPAPEYCYLAGIDPMFAYYKKPDAMRTIELLRTGKRYSGPEELFAATGTRYIFVSYHNHRLSADLFTKGYVAVYQGMDGNLFDLKLSLDNINK